MIEAFAGMIVAALVEPCGELGEQADVLLLHGLAWADSHFVAQQDSQPFVRRECLRHIPSGCECAHQQQMSGLSERGRFDQFTPGTLRTRQLSTPEA
jgi:hypothetical protein